MNRQSGLGIWIYQQYFPKPLLSVCLTLHEGTTSLKKIGGILFKCEFENPTGSIKDRGIAYQISALASQGTKKAVISSSGNAGISAAYYCHSAHINLTVFISPHINAQKLAILEKLNCRIIQTKKPVSGAFKYTKENKAFNLRQSIDDNAVIGYETIAYELNEAEVKIDAIFIPVSSGTILTGIASGFHKLGKSCAIHAVQTEAIHPIASLFDKDFTSQKKSLADAIVAKYTPRQEQVITVIKKSKGSGWVISDQDIKKADVWLKSHRMNCSYEGAAALAAFWKAGKHGFNYKNPVCLLTGRRY